MFASRTDGASGDDDSLEVQEFRKMTSSRKASSASKTGVMTMTDQMASKVIRQLHFALQEQVWTDLQSDMNTKNDLYVRKLAEGLLKYTRIRSIEVTNTSDNHNATATNSNDNTLADVQRDDVEQDKSHQSYIYQLLSKLSQSYGRELSISSSEFESLDNKHVSKVDDPIRTSNSSVTHNEEIDVGSDHESDGGATVLLNLFRKLGHEDNLALSALKACDYEFYVRLLAWMRQLITSTKTVFHVVANIKNSYQSIKLIQQYPTTTSTTTENLVTGESASNNLSIPVITTSVIHTIPLVFYVLDPQSQHRLKLCSMQWRVEMLFSNNFARIEEVSFGTSQIESADLPFASVKHIAGIQHRLLKCLDSLKKASSKL